MGGGSRGRDYCDGKEGRKRKENCNTKRGERESGRIYIYIYTVVLIGSQFLALLSTRDMSRNGRGFYTFEKGECVVSLPHFFLACLVYFVSGPPNKHEFGLCILTGKLGFQIHIYILTFTYLCLKGFTTSRGRGKGGGMAVYRGIKGIKREEMVKLFNFITSLVIRGNTGGLK